MEYIVLNNFPVLSEKHEVCTSSIFIHELSVAASAVGIRDENDSCDVVLCSSVNQLEQVNKFMWLTKHRF